MEKNKYSVIDVHLHFAIPLGLTSHRRIIHLELHHDRSIRDNLTTRVSQLPLERQQLRFRFRCKAISQGSY